MIEFLMGGVSAAVSRTIFAPIEQIKPKYYYMDTVTINSGALKKPYLGIVDCFKRYIAENGVKVLWKGNGTNVIRYVPTQALNFSLKDYFKRYFGKN